MIHGKEWCDWAVSEIKELLNFIFNADYVGIIYVGILAIVSFDKLSVIVCKWFPMIFGETKTMKEKRKMQEDINRQAEQIKQLYDYESDTHQDVRDIKCMLQDHMRIDNERTVSSFRSTLYRLHMEFTGQKYVTPEGLKTFKEIGKVYTEAGGDDIYHDKLEPEVLALPLKQK